jgi:hypothetical protein
MGWWAGAFSYKGLVFASKKLVIFEMEVREEAAGPTPTSSSSPSEGNGGGPLAPPKKTLNTGVEALSLWVEEKLRLGQVPRISDMIEMSKRDGFSVKRSDLLKMLQENPVYMFNMHQQKKGWVLDLTDR